MTACVLCGAPVRDGEPHLTNAHERSAAHERCIRDHHYGFDPLVEAAVPRLGERCPTCGQRYEAAGDRAFCPDCP